MMVWHYWCTHGARHENPVKKKKGFDFLLGIYLFYVYGRFFFLKKTLGDTFWGSLIKTVLRRCIVVRVSVCLCVFVPSPRVPGQRQR